MGPSVLNVGRRVHDCTIEREARAGVWGLLRTLECVWVNHPDAIREAAHKPHQLALAHRLGLNSYTRCFVPHMKTQATSEKKGTDFYPLTPTYSVGHVGVNGARLDPYGWFTNLVI